MSDDTAASPILKVADDQPREPQPSVGRIVLYTPMSGDPVNHYSVEPCAAVVTKVWGVDCLNLQVLPDMAAPFCVSSVMRGVPGVFRSWHWPPRT